MIWLLERCPDWSLDLLVKALEWAEDRVELAIYNRHVRKWAGRLHGD